MKEIKGITFNIQKFSTEDGPGIRTTVFMKGCPLRCAWCHNPEGMRATPDLMWYDMRCIAARDCIETCPAGALTLSEDGMQIDRQRCNLCGACVQACPSAALEMIGEQWTTTQLMEEILKDQVFYETSGGGVTFSGGEPANQVEFLEKVFPRCKEAGIHIALDTCGALPWERYRSLLSWVDLVLLDIKIMDNDDHKQATGISNEVILANARKIAQENIPMWIRTPIIPGFTYQPENIIAIGEFIQKNLGTVQRWDLLAYTNLGRPKYHRLNIPYTLEKTPLLTQEEMENVWQIAYKIVPVAQWSGATRN